MTHFISDLTIGDCFNNQKLCDYFRCSPQGGMRRSHQTNTLVLVADHTRASSPYTDLWKDDVFHYTGMGLKGDQSLTFMQNKTLNESPSNGVALHLFEEFHPKVYTYQGQVF